MARQTRNYLRGMDPSLTCHACRCATSRRMSLCLGCRGTYRQYVSIRRYVQGMYRRTVIRPKSVRYHVQKQRSSVGKASKFTAVGVGSSRRSRRWRDFCPKFTAVLKICPLSFIYELIIGTYRYVLQYTIHAQDVPTYYVPRQPSRIRYGVHHLGAPPLCCSIYKQATTSGESRITRTYHWS